MHACKYIQLMIIIQVEGEQHEHHEIIQKLHQNLRDTFVSEPTWRGKVALMCADDLEKMPLNQLAYNKKRPVVEGKERTAPTYNFDSSRKLTFTTFLILTTDTRANRERQSGKRKRLERVHTRTTLLPLDERRQMHAESVATGTPAPEKLKSVRFPITDRSGLPITVIKSWAKSEQGEHLQHSQPSTSFQHAEDLVQFIHEITRVRREGVPDKFALAQELLGSNGQVVPYIILTTDGPNEQSVRWLQNVLPLWCVMMVLDLDGIEKIHYCPGHSKDNPDEMLNRTVKDAFRGVYLGVSEDNPADMHTAKCAAAKMLEVKTHAGEPVLTFISEPGGHWKSEHERQKYEFTINSYEGLKDFVEERKKHAPAWHTDDPPEDMVSMWAEQDADVVDARSEPRQWAHLEELVQQMKYHISFLNIYGIALRKCTGHTKCKFCADHPPRGDYIKQIPRDLLTDACNPPCTEQPCTHTLNIEYSGIMAVLNNLAPDLCVPRKCGYCRAVGHNILGCPQVPPDHPKHKSNRKPKKK